MPSSVDYGNKMRGDKNIWGIAPRLPEEFFILPDAEAGLAEMLGGGGSGMSFRMGQPVNQLDQMIEYSKGKPGEFKMATDQYAARYSDQLDQMAIEELSKSIPTTDWVANNEASKAAAKNYYETGELWGPHNKPSYSVNKAENNFQNMMGAQPAFTSGPLSGAASRNRDGISAPSVTKFISRNKGVSPGAGGSRTYGGTPGGGTRYGGRYGL